MHIKRYIFLLCTIIFITGINCSSHLDTINAAKLSWEFPILDKEKDVVVKWDGSSKLFFYKGNLLYEKEGIFTHKDNREEKVYTYWMYSQNLKKGIKFEGSYKDTVGLVFDVDSFLVKNAFKNFPFYSKENDSLFSRKSNSKELIEKYIPKNRPDDSYPDTMIFRYSKDYQDVPFSFSPEMEHGKNKRLIEISNIYNPVLNTKFKSQKQVRKMTFLLEKIPVENQQEKLLYFKLFEKKSQKLK